MNTYNWIISALECKVKEGDLTDVVYIVHWRYDATNENEVSAEIYGAESIAFPNPEDFIPYPELTKDQVVGWLEASLDVPKLQLYLDEQIDLIVNPINVTLPPPFEN